MAKGKKVKPKAKPSPPPSDISSSELSESSSDDDLSDDDEFIQVTKNLDPKTKIFITKLMEDLETIQAELATRDDDLFEQEKMYIACKEALVLERSEVDSLNKALTEEQREHALTKKSNIALNDKYCVLVEKHNKLKGQYSFLWESTPQPSNTKDTSNPSTGQGCGKCYNLDLNVYSTNLANMEAMKKEIARLNAMLSERCMKDKSAISG
jgi:chromosome segregation ATPase